MDLNELLIWSKEADRVSIIKIDKDTVLLYRLKNIADFGTYMQFDDLQIRKNPLIEELEDYPIGG